MFWLSDKQIASFVKGDEEAFGDFYNASIDVFYRYMKWRYFFQQDSDIDDLLSDIYLKIWKWIQKYNPSYSLEWYIRSIYKNHIKDFFKKKRLNYPDINEMSLWEDEASWEDMYIQMAEQDYTLEHIYTAMDQLEEAQYQILFFKLVEWYSYEEISDKLWLPQATLRKRFSRALSKLKYMLEGKEGLNSLSDTKS